MPDKTLGTVELKSGTFEHDIAVVDRFQRFSTELLRISLIGISAIGYVIFRMPLDEAGLGLRDSPTAKSLVIVSLVCLGIAASSALLHRYPSTDSISWHLQSMRRYSRGAEDDLETAERDRELRHSQARAASRSLRLSVTCLAISAVSLVATAWILLVS